MQLGLAAVVGLGLGWVTRIIVFPDPKVSDAISVHYEESLDRSEPPIDSVVAGRALPASVSQLDGISSEGVLSAASRSLMLKVPRLAKESADDFRAFVKAARGGFYMQEQVLKQWARVDPSGLYRTLQAEHLISSQLKRWSVFIFKEWIVQDPAAAILALAESEVNDPSLRIKMEVVDVLLEENLFGALLDVLISDSKTGVSSLDRLLDEEKCRYWVSQNLDLAVAKADGFNAKGIVEDWSRSEYIATIGEIAAEAGIRSAVEKVNSLPQGNRLAFLTGVLRDAEIDDPVEFLEFLTTKVTSAYALSAAQPVLEHLALDDPGASIHWAKSHLKGKARVDAVVEVMDFLADDSLEKATAALENHTQGAIKNAATSRVLRSLISDLEDNSSTEILERWMLSFPDEEALAFAVDRSAGPFEEDCPRDFLRWMSTLDYPAVARPWVVRYMAGKLQKGNELVLGEWLQSLPARNRTIAERVLQEN